MRALLRHVPTLRRPLPPSTTCLLALLPCLPCPPSCRLDALRKGMADCVDRCRKLEPVEGCSFMDGEGAEAGRV